MGDATPRRIRRTEKQWAEILRRFEASGLSSRDFCSREGLTPSSLQRWRSRCGREREPQFVELTPASTPASTLPTASSTSWALELNFPDGTCVRFRG